MRCKACDKSMDPLQLFRQVDGVDHLVIEDLCSECLYIVRAMNYDGGPDNEVEEIMATIGVGNVATVDSEE